MPTFHLAVEARLLPGALVDDDMFEAFVDQTVAELDQLGFEVDVACSLRDCTVEFAWSADTPTPEVTVRVLVTAVREALRLAQLATPGWPPLAKVCVTRALLEGVDRYEFLPADQLVPEKLE